MNNFEQNSNFGYYPEELIFDEKTQTLKKVNSADAVEIHGKEKQNQKGGFNFGNLSGELLSKMFDGNDALSTMLAGGLANGVQKNNIIMQALNNLNNNKKKLQKEKVVETEDYFEEL